MSSAGAQVTPGQEGPGAAPADTLSGEPPEPQAVPDTLAEDTVQVPIPPEEVAGDTVPDAIQQAAESFADVPILPELPTLVGPSWAAGRWEWDRDELARLPGMTLLEFIELLPGMTRMRAGGFGRPEAVHALGAGGARVRVLLDGFELDPLGTGAFPLETIALLDLERVRIERTVSEVRVEIESFRLRTPEPFSTVELGTGAAETRVLRALFSRGFQDGRSVGTGSYDLASTGGIGIGEEYSHSSTSLRWSHAFNDVTGAQVQWRRASSDRGGDVFPQQRTRSDLMLLVRSRLLDELLVEGFLGRSASEEEAESGGPGVFRSNQAGLRAIFARGPLGAEAVARVRDRGEPVVPLPRTEAEGNLVLQPIGSLRLEAHARLAEAQGQSASQARLLTQVTLPAGISAFAQASVGSALLPYYQLEEVQAEEDATTLVRRGSSVLSSADGWRAGSELSRSFGRLGLAAFETRVTPALPFSLPFDLGSPAFEAAPTRGGEVYAHLLVPRTNGAFRIEGWFSHFDDVAARPYTPTNIGRVAVIFHDVFYDGQLEPTLRLEGIHRGSAVVPAQPGGGFDSVTQPYRTLDLSLNIRILAIRMFLLWENVLNEQMATDFPDVPLAYPRIIYGARWQFLD